MNYISVNYIYEYYSLWHLLPISISILNPITVNTSLLLEEVSIDPNVAEKQEGDAGFINYNRDVLSVVFEQLKVRSIIPLISPSYSYWILLTRNVQYVICIDPNTRETRSIPSLASLPLGFAGSRGCNFSSTATMGPR